MSKMGQKRILDSRIQVSIESAWSLGAKNPFADLDCVKKLAFLIISNEDILQVIAPFVTEIFIAKGYSKETIVPLRRRMLLIEPLSLVKEAINALESIADEYEQAIKSGRHYDNLAGDISSGISECVVFNLLAVNGKTEAETTKDAFVYQESKIISSKNIDFIWANTLENAVGIYECKNQPNQLLHQYELHDRFGCEAEYKNTKIWLILKLFQLFNNAGWKVHIAVISLRTRDNHKHHLNIPSGFDIYYQEDLKAFPNSHPQFTGN